MGFDVCVRYVYENYFVVCFIHGPRGHGVHQHSLYARGVCVTSVLWWLRQKCTLYRVDVLSSDDNDDVVRGTFAVCARWILSEFQLPLVARVCSVVMRKRQLFVVAERTE